MSSKGFILSLSTLLFMSVLLYFTFFYVSSIQDNQGNILNTNKLSKANLVRDDILSDINRILGKTITGDRNSTHGLIQIFDKFPLDHNQQFLRNLERFVEGNYANKQNMDIILNVARLVDARQEIIFKSGLRYTYTPDTSDGNNIIDFFVSNRDTNFTSIDINLTVKGRYYDYNAWDYNSSGTINMRINYKDYDSNHTFTSEGKLLKTVRNQFLIRFSNSDTNSIRIHFGTIDGNVASLRIIESFDSNADSAKVAIKALYPTVSEIVWQANADLNLSYQDVNFNQMLEMGRV